MNNLLEMKNSCVPFRHQFNFVRLRERLIRLSFHIYCVLFKSRKKFIDHIAIHHIAIVMEIMERGSF